MDLPREVTPPFACGPAPTPRVETGSLIGTHTFRGIVYVRLSHFLQYLDDEADELDADRPEAALVLRALAERLREDLS